MYDTAEEAQQKLKDTVVFWNNEPVYVLGARMNQDNTVGVAIRPLDGSKYGTELDGWKLITDKEFEFRRLGPHLGYMNYEQGLYRQAVFTRRMPVRKAHSTQGLSRYNVKVSPLKADKRVGVNHSPIGFNNLINVKSVVDSLSGRFPTYLDIKNVFADPNSTVTSKAFHRLFSVSRGMLGLYFIEYKDTPIGYTEDFEKIKLDRAYRHVVESLVEECQVPARIVV